MKKTIGRTIALLAAVCVLCAQALALPETLVPVGRTVGIRLEAQPVVTGFSGEGCARDAGVRIGDCIVSVDGSRIDSAEALRQRIGPEPLRLGVTRDGDYLEFTVTPVKTGEDERIGLRLRDGITGVGTVTFYDPATGRCGALGHGVNDPDTARPVQAAGGSLMAARVTAAVRGTAGRPGELKASFSADEPVGRIERATAAGLFGTMRPPRGSRALPLAAASQVRADRAMILSNVEGDTVQEFAVEILKIDPENGEGRNFLLHVCDEALIGRTGGIVQGMSGSPIVQDGRLVGAVTHVLVDDPTLGYGISIETMLAGAQPASQTAGATSK